MSASWYGSLSRQIQRRCRLACRCGLQSSRLLATAATPPPDGQPVLTSKHATEVLKDAIQMNGGALAVNQLRQLYRRRRGLKAVLDDVGGLKAFVVGHPKIFTWETNRILLADADCTELLPSRALNSGEVSTALRILVRDQGSCMPLQEMGMLLALHPEISDAVSEAGGLKAFIEKEGHGLVVQEDMVYLASQFLVAMLDERGGYLSDAEFTDLCQRHPTLQASVVYMEAGPTFSDKEALVAKYVSWREDRMEIAPPTEEPLPASSFDWWYGEACLLCSKHCPLDSYEKHAQSAGHLEEYSRSERWQLKTTAATALGRSQLDPDSSRPPKETPWAELMGDLRIADKSVLVVGESDFTWPVRLAEWQKDVGASIQVVATSELLSHDPGEAVVHLCKGAPAWFPRRSLPSMQGVLGANLAKLEALGATIAYGVDVRRLSQTMPSSVAERLPVDIVLFSFPQASPCSSHHNALLLDDYFKAAADMDVLAGDGSLILVMLPTQFSSWDIARLAARHGFHLTCCVSLPEDLRKARSLTGTLWYPDSAFLYELKRYHGEGNQQLDVVE